MRTASFPPGAPLVRPIAVDPARLPELQARHPARYPAFLQSAATGTPLGRFDILMASAEDRLTLDPSGRLDAPFPLGATGSFLDALDRWWQGLQRPGCGGTLPFTGGWFIYLGYELAGEIEPSLSLPAARDWPVATAIRVPAAAIHDHATHSTWLVAEPGRNDCLREIEADLAALPPPPAAGPAFADILTGAVGEDPPEAFIRAVEAALAHIAAGDIYQANLSRGWQATLREGVTPLDVHRRLCRANPGPFAGLVRLDDRAIISSSPERLLEVRDGRIATRPIAGTRPRSADPLADRNLALELAAHPKERAEHVMLIDLERNDLGRVCEAGSVRVDEYMTVESYAHVHHIVSNVSGRLRPGVTPGEVVRAVFPGGTITGCPKVRCIELIGALERGPRGVYTGSMGYLNRDGSMDLNILIRTLALDGRQVSLRAGAGIVADSDPVRELAETRAKARGLLAALAPEMTTA